MGSLEQNIILTREFSGHFNFVANEHPKVATVTKVPIALKEQITQNVTLVVLASYLVWACFVLSLILKKKFTSKNLVKNVLPSLTLMIWVASTFPEDFSSLIFIVHSKT